MPLYAEVWIARRAWYRLSARKQRSILNGVVSAVRRQRPGLDIVRIAVNPTARVRTPSAARTRTGGAQRTEAGTPDRCLIVWRLPERGRLDRVAPLLADTGWRTYFRPERPRRRGVWLSEATSGSDNSEEAAGPDAPGGETRNRSSGPSVDDISEPLRPYAPVSKARSCSNLQ